MRGGKSDSPAVTVVIAVYERADVLNLVLTSLANQSFRDFEVVVADDGSGDDVKSLVNEHASRAVLSVRHVWHPDDGFRKTIIANRAVADARGDYIVFIDGDCLLHHRFLERHYKRRKMGQILSGRRVMFDVELTERVSNSDVSSRRMERPSFWIRNCGQHDRRNGFYMPFAYRFKNAFRDDYEILGCNFSAHKEDFYAVNGYDEDIVGRGLEDNDLCTRFINFGFKLKCITHEALQYHLHHESDPIPHSHETIARHLGASGSVAASGIVKE